jgi:hypothetical protein
MPKRLLGALAITAALGFSSAAPTSAAPPPHTDPPVIGATTVITGHGVVGATLRVPRAADVPDPANFDLSLEGGTYAYIRLVSDSAESAAWCSSEPDCIDWSFLRLREVATPTSPNAFVTLPGPSVFYAGSLRVVILSDGVATLTVHVNNGAGLPATTRVTATQPVHAQFARMAPACTLPAVAGVPGPQCTPQVATLATGQAWDLGGPGLVIAMALTWEKAPSQNGSHAAEACTYPNGYDPSGSPDPAAHPAGCDTASSASPASARYAVATQASMAVQGAWPTTGGSVAYFWGGAQGAVYVGGIARFASTQESEAEVIGIWISAPSAPHKPAAPAPAPTKRQSTSAASGPTRIRRPLAL